MIKKLRFSSTLCALTVCFLATSAGADVRQDVAMLMEHIRKREVADYNTIRLAPPLEVINALDPYRVDTEERIRSQALLYIADIAGRSGELPALQEAVRLILDSASKEKSPPVVRNSLNSLLAFPRSAFNTQAQQIIRDLVVAQNPSPFVLLLSGIVEDQSVKERLKQLAETPIDTTVPGWWGRQPWAAHLALARLGDAAEIQFCINMVEKIRDATTRTTRLLKDLDYIRQPQTVNVLIKYLLSEGVLAGSFPDVPSARYSDYVLPLLARSIEEFPQQNVKLGESETWFSRAYEWIKVHKTNLKIKR